MNVRWDGPLREEARQREGWCLEGGGTCLVWWFLYVLEGRGTWNCWDRQSAVQGMDILGPWIEFLLL